MRRLILVTGMAVLASLIGTHAEAAWPHDPFASGVLVSPLAGNQELPAIVPDGAGGSLIAWNVQGSPGVVIQRLDANGAPLWAPIGVNVSTTDAHGVQLLADGAGGAVVVWEDDRTAGRSSIYAQRVNSAGVPQWTANGVLVMTGGTRIFARDARLINDGAGGAIVCCRQTTIIMEIEGPYRVRAQRLDGSGVRLWGTNGVALSSLSGEQADPELVTDTAGGALVCWSEFRTNQRVYVQRLNASGAALWTVNGVQASPSTVGFVGQYQATIAPDGSGGALVAWSDARNEGGNYTDIYSQRLNSIGALQWGTSGIAVAQAGFSQSSPTMIPDGIGGAFVAWTDGRAGLYGIYAQQVFSGGTHGLAPGGALVSTAGANAIGTQLVSDGASGVFVVYTDYRDILGDVLVRRIKATGALVPASEPARAATSAGGQFNPVIASDASGGVIVAWQDVRGGTYDIYAQRVDSYGYLGHVRSDITAVRDVANDQGGRVKLSWRASYIDDVYSSGRYYEVFTRQGAAPWALASTQQSGPLAQYSMTVPLPADSGATNPFTQFMVRVHAGPGANDPFWDSLPDSGYSVDNLAPAGITGLEGSYRDGVTRLQWTPSGEFDLVGYRVYRGASPDFEPSSGRLVGTSSEPEWTDAAGAPWIYRIVAVDRHGNESVSTRWIPDVPLNSAPPSTAVATRLYGARPNPSGPLTELAFDLTRECEVSLEVFDVSGQRVATLVGGRLPAGQHKVRWDNARAGARNTPPGIYLVRFTADGVVGTQRVVRMP